MNENQYRDAANVAERAEQVVEQTRQLAIDIIDGREPDATAIAKQAAPLQSLVDEVRDLRAVLAILCREASVGPVWSMIESLLQPIDDACRGTLPVPGTWSKDRCQYREAARIISRHVTVDWSQDCRRIADAAFVRISDEAESDELERYADVAEGLSIRQRRIFSEMMRVRRTGTFDQLADVSDAWQVDDPSDDAINRQLKEIREKLPRSEFGLKISLAGRTFTWAKRPAR